MNTHDGSKLPKPAGKKWRICYLCAEVCQATRPRPQKHPALPGRFAATKPAAQTDAGAQVAKHRCALLAGATSGDTPSDEKEEEEEEEEEARELNTATLRHVAPCCAMLHIPTTAWEF